MLHVASENSFTSDEGTYFHSHIVGVSVLRQERETSVSQEVRGGALDVCDKYIVLPVEIVCHCGDF